MDLGLAPIGRRASCRGATRRRGRLAKAQRQTDVQGAETGLAESTCPSPGRPGVREQGDCSCSPHVGAGDLEGKAGEWSWATLGGKYKILAASAGAFIICNMDKVNMSVAIIPMAQDFGWGPSISGLVQSSFFLGYFLFQIPGGYLSSRFSGSRVLPTGVALWSLATVGVPMLGATIPGLCLSRALVGLGEAVSPAAATDMVARIMPREERSRATAFIFAGLHVGSLLGLLISPLLIEGFGWPAVFTCFGGLGLIWVAWFQLVLSDVVQKEKGVAEDLKGRGISTKDQEPIPWSRLLKSQPVQALMFTHFCNNWFQFTMLAWLPTYLKDTLGVSLANAAELSLLPPLAAITTSAIAGPLADYLISNGWKVATVRKLAQCVAFLGPMVCLACATTSDTGSWKVGFITAALGLASFSLAGLYCNHQDLSPKYAGVLLGITNTAGALPGIIGVAVTGILMDQTDSWTLSLFVPSMIFFLAGSIVFTLYGRGDLLQFADDSAS
ncbi:unnamed protein product [Ostreobium quekettii]|uniref:Major facilitator superfamily (MFS) profile domain-containing protein n=1 Tax=Ostreobium quekettii TaxID=121088 RepID=A0A8S1J237_9CHLO|nr:unnamed protein product [Ostreobium quekettii]